MSSFIDLQQLTNMQIKTKDLTGLLNSQYAMLQKMYQMDWTKYLSLKRQYSDKQKQYQQDKISKLDNLKKDIFKIGLYDKWVFRDQFAEKQLQNQRQDICTDNHPTFRLTVFPMVPNEYDGTVYLNHNTAQIFWEASKGLIPGIYCISNRQSLNKNNPKNNFEQPILIGAYYCYINEYQRFLLCVGLKYQDGQPIPYLIIYVVISSGETKKYESNITTGYYFSSDSSYLQQEDENILYQPCPSLPCTNDYPVYTLFNEEDKQYICFTTSNNANGEVLYEYNFMNLLQYKASYKQIPYSWDCIIDCNIDPKDRYYNWNIDTYPITLTKDQDGNFISMSVEKQDLTRYLGQQCQMLNILYDQDNSKLDNFQKIFNKYDNNKNEQLSDLKQAIFPIGLYDKWFFRDQFTYLDLQQQDGKQCIYKGKDNKLRLTVFPVAPKCDIQNNTFENVYLNERTVEYFWNIGQNSNLQSGIYCISNKNFLQYYNNNQVISEGPILMGAYYCKTYGQQLLVCVGFKQQYQQQQRIPQIIIYYNNGSQLLTYISNITNQYYLSDYNNNDKNLLYQPCPSLPCTNDYPVYISSNSGEKVFIQYSEDTKQQKYNFMNLFIYQLSNNNYQIINNIDQYQQYQQQYNWDTNIYPITLTKDQNGNFTDISMEKQDLNNYLNQQYQILDILYKQDNNKLSNFQKIFDRYDKDKKQQLSDLKEAIFKIGLYDKWFFRDQFIQMQIRDKKTQMDADFFIGHVTSWSGVEQDDNRIKLTVFPIKLPYDYSFEQSGCVLLTAENLQKIWEVGQNLDAGIYCISALPKDYYKNNYTTPDSGEFNLIGGYYCKISQTDQNPEKQFLFCVGGMYNSSTPKIMIHYKDDEQDYIYESNMPIQGNTFYNFYQMSGPGEYNEYNPCQYLPCPSFDPLYYFSNKRDPKNEKRIQYLLYNTRYIDNKTENIYRYVEQHIYEFVDLFVYTVIVEYYEQNGTYYDHKYTYEITNSVEDVKNQYIFTLI